MTTSPATVVVTGANGLVGSHVVAALSERGAAVRAVVRRPGTAPSLPGVDERVGDFADPAFAAEVTGGSDALVTTVHPMGDDRASQQRVGIEGTLIIADAAQAAGAELHVHVSTAGVYDRSPGRGDVAEDGALVDDGGGDYAVVKRDIDAALADRSGTTRVLVRPPAILGRSEASVWNVLRPAQVAGDEGQRHAVADGTFAWVHVEDLATLIADVATGRIAAGDDIDRGPVVGGCTPVNAAGEPATQRDYLGTVAAAVGVEPTWDDEPAWTGQIATGRARGWGWSPRVTLDRALDELRDGLRG